MLFNSLDFAIFLPIVFLLYWFVVKKPLQLQNLLILTASYIFYGWWDWRFLLLILASTFTDYFIGIALGNTDRKAKRKFLLWGSILVNIGILGFFKYFNFFIENFISAFSYFGLSAEYNSLSIILPVGISFYTFQTMSYTIDIYRGHLKPSKDFIAFAAFVAFFPQLVAGPIERARNLLPQFRKARVFTYEKAVDGLRQILWGLFKKMLIADNCAEYANYIFNNSADHSGSTLLLGALFFTFQIYGDFSGYSDIAIGTARLFGFNLMQNFAVPYFSRDIAEFWRRWHISLSTWFRDYVYIPLGGSRVSKTASIRNIFIIFIVSGFWHGANWTFIIWGALNAIYFLPLMLSKRNRRNIDTVAKGMFLPSLRETIGMLSTFALTVFAWIFFRAESVSHAIEYIGGIFSKSILSIPVYRPRELFILILLFLIVEWIGREEQYAFAKIAKVNSLAVRWASYFTLIALIFYWMGTQQQFIYFQF